MPVEIKVVLPAAAAADDDVAHVNGVPASQSETGKIRQNTNHEGLNRQQTRTRPASAPPPQTMSIRIPVATNYDVDNEYDYIMDKALNAYKKHCDKERADARQRVLRSSYRKRLLLSQNPRPGKHAAGARPRPWSALPSKFDAIKEIRHANMAAPDSAPRKVLNVRTITLGSGAMEGALARKSSNYQRRNKTTHSWYTQSFPNASFLQQPSNYIPRRSQSQTTSPVKMDDKKAGYEYDGGLFNATSPRRDYFVIHPDWVSESVTIQKLSLNERNRKTKSMTWPGRRCRSAPPPKLRNPITWE